MFKLSHDKGFNVTDFLGTAFPDEISPDAIYFDNVGPSYFRATSMTGLSNTDMFTCSVWVNPNTVTTTPFVAFDATAHAGGFERFQIGLVSGGSIQLSARNTVDTTILAAQTAAGTITNAAGWQHILVSLDLSDTEKRVVVVDGVIIPDGDITWTTYTSDTIDYTSFDTVAIGHHYGSTSGGASASAFYNGCLTELWFSVKEYVDFRDPKNIRRFRTTEGHPVDLGSDGSDPTGTQPDIYCSEDVESFATNAGSGSNFTRGLGVNNCEEPPNPSHYISTAVDFDGSTNYAQRAATLGGSPTNNKLLTVSAWVKTDDSAGNSERILASHGGTFVGLQLMYNTSEQFELRWNIPSSPGTELLKVTSDYTFTLSDGWIHYLFSCDLSDTGKRNLYINSLADSATYVTYSNTTLDWDTPDEWTIGALNDTPSNPWDGCLADIWISNAYYDLSDINVRRNFFEASGHPSDMTGFGSPLIYLRNKAESYHKNLGSGGAFSSIGGTLTDCASSPSLTSALALAGEYLPDGTDLDGTGDYYTVGSMTGASDSKTMSCSFWIKLDAITGTDIIYSQEASSPAIQSRIEVESDGTIHVFWEDTSGNVDVDFESGSGALTTGDWQHVAIAFNAATGDHEIYVDGSADLAGGGTVNDDTMDHTVDDYTIGSSAGGGDDVDGCISEFWLTFGEYVDFSVTAIRERFHAGAQNPQYLGDDGSLPTSSQPDIYCTGGEASFGTNLGSGSNFTKTGNPTDCDFGPGGFSLED